MSQEQTREPEVLVTPGEPEQEKIKDVNSNIEQNLEASSRIRLEKPKIPNKVLTEVIEEFI